MYYMGKLKDIEVYQESIANYKINKEEYEKNCTFYVVSGELFLHGYKIGEVYAGRVAEFDEDKFTKALKEGSKKKIQETTKDFIEAINNVKESAEMQTISAEKLGKATVEAGAAYDMTFFDKEDWASVIEKELNVLKDNWKGM